MIFSTARMGPSTTRRTVAFASGSVPTLLLGITVVAVSAILAAWIEFALVGSSSVPPVPQIYPNNFAGPYGFPLLLEDPWRLNPVTGKAGSLHCDDRSPPSEDSFE